MEKAKQGCISGQCEVIETCLNKNNIKRAYQLMKDLTSDKQGRSSTLQDKSWNFLLKNKRFSADGQNIAQNCTTTTVAETTQYWTAVSPAEEALQPILRDEVEIAVASLKKGKSAGFDNIPAELVHGGGETMINVFTEICNRI